MPGGGSLVPPPPDADDVETGDDGVAEHGDDFVVQDDEAPSAVLASTPAAGFDDSGDTPPVMAQPRDEPSVAQTPSEGTDQGPTDR